VAVDKENVQKLMEWLAQDSPVRSDVSAEALAEKLTAVVFQGDAQWADRPDQADDYRDSLNSWLSTDSSHEQQFVALTAPDADPGMFVDWFLSVVAGWESQAAGQQSATAADGNPAAGAEQGRYSEPARDDAYGLTYRYDLQSGVYEWYDEVGQTWQDQAWADQHAAGGPGAAAQAPAADSAADPAPMWDENWKMFYRVDATGAYQFADAVTPGDESSGCGETWLSQEQVLARAEQPPQSAGGSLDTSGAGPHAAAADAVHNEMLTALGSALEARPELKGVLTDDHMKALLADVARELIG
jgi:hypothetical protein